MRGALEQMRAANQERQQEQQSAAATLTALKVLCLAMSQHMTSAFITAPSALLSALYNSVI